MQTTLTQGLQTKATPNIKNISDSLDGDGLKYCLSALYWAHENISNDLPTNIKKNDVFRKRTADQIINDKYFSGCTDNALVFIALCNAKGISTKYIEAVRRRWLEEGGDSMEGHIFVECLINDKWFQVDPQKGAIQAFMDYRGFVIMAKGLDAWDIGMDSIEAVEKKFTEFRKKFNSPH